MRPLLNIPSPSGDRPAGSYSRIIPAEELGAFNTWQPGAITGNSPQLQPLPFQRPASKPQGQTAADDPPSAEVQQALVEARKSGYDEGYRDGMAALESFKKSHADKLQAQNDTKLAQWLASLDAEWSQLEPRMAQSLSQAAVRLARQVLRQELQTQPEHVLGLAREAVQSIAQSARRIELLAHPDDVPLLQSGLGETLQARGGRIRPEASLARGGCRVHADLAAVDASLEQRWAEAAQAMGSDLPLNDDPKASGADDA